MFNHHGFTKTKGCSGLMDHVPLCIHYSRLRGLVKHLAVQNINSWTVRSSEQIRTVTSRTIGTPDLKIVLNQIQSTSGTCKETGMSLKGFCEFRKLGCFRFYLERYLSSKRHYLWHKVLFGLQARYIKRFEVKAAPAQETKALG